MISDTPEFTLVSQLPPDPLLIDEKVVEEVTLAAPEVVGEAETGEERVGDQLPDWKVGQEIVVESQQCELLEIGEGLGSDTCKVIVVQIKLFQFGQTCKLTSSQIRQLVRLKVKHSQLKKCLF